ncbi:MAG: VWA domain-containing protein [Polyangiaceae bacterium]
MSDPRAVTRVLDELLWTLRRSGLIISTSQAIDAMRAIAAVGLEDRALVREAVACVVVHRAGDRLRFDRAFDRFFATGEHRGTVWERLAARGFSESELGELRELLERFVETGGEGAQHLGVLLERGAELDRMLQLTGVVRALEAMQSSLQVGFFTHRVLHQIGVPKAHQALAALRAHLRESLGDARGDALADALKAELERAGDDVRDHVTRTHARREEETRAARPSLETTAFTSLSDAQMVEVRRAVRAFAERLRGRERVRIKRKKQGRIDPHRTLRRALATGGVPFAPLRRGRPRDKPRLILLCDVSDSVRSAATFMLEFVYASHELFERTRSFVFVSELGETTELFKREPVSVALGKAYGGGLVSVADNSNYGRVLRTFEAEHLRDVDRRTTVVILGDGRTNYHEDSAEILGQIRARARAVIWLCPEARGGWALGDSAMARYEPMCTQVLEVGTVRELEEAARLLVALR